MIHPFKKHNFEKIEKNHYDLTKSICVVGKNNKSVNLIGIILSRSMAKDGMSIFNYVTSSKNNEFYYTIHFSPYPVYTKAYKYDGVICLDKEVLSPGKQNIKPDGVFIYNPKVINLNSDDMRHSSFIPIDINIPDKFNINDETNLHFYYILILAEIFGISTQNVSKTIKEYFPNTNPKDINKKIHDISLIDISQYKGIKKFSESDISKAYLIKKDVKDTVLISGCEILWLALLASCTDYISYTNHHNLYSLVFLFEHASKEYSNIITNEEVNTEQACDAALGASYSGARSVCVLKGDDYPRLTSRINETSLMEIPILFIFIINRKFNFINFIDSLLDNFLPIIFLPSDIKECFEYTTKLLNLSSNYKIPSIMLLDERFLKSTQSTHMDLKQEINIESGQVLSSKLLSRINLKVNEDLPSTEGVPSKILPGQKEGEHIVTADIPEERLQRIKDKYKIIQNHYPQLNVYGDIRSRLCLITTGYLKGSILEVMRKLQSIKISSKLICINYIHQSLFTELEKLIHTSRNVIVIDDLKTKYIEKLINQIDAETEITSYHTANPEILISKIKEDILEQ